MQKKLSLVLLSVVFLSLFPSVVSAETATSPSTLKLQIKDLQQERKETITQTKGDILVLRDQFKARLQTIKDARKKLLVEKLDLNISQANAKHTARFSELLTKLQTILDKFSASTSALPNVLSDINNAQNAINIAKDAVASQSAKVYTIQITTEPNLKMNVGATVSQFRQDLMAVYKLVIDAKQAVQKLNTDREDIKKEATSSAKL